MFFTYSISMEGGVKYEKIIVFKFLFGGNKHYLGFYSVNDKFADFRNNKKCKYSKAEQKRFSKQKKMGR